MRRLRTSGQRGRVRIDGLLAVAMLAVIGGVALAALLVDPPDRPVRASADGSAVPATAPSGGDGGTGGTTDDASLGSAASGGDAPAPGVGGAPDGARDTDERSRAPWMVPARGSLLHGSRFGSVDGFLVFRGNPTRTFYGEGPVPREPAIAWSAPSERMCSVEELADERKVWRGVGWTGQVVLLDNGGDGITAVEVMVGGYDGGFHTFDGATGAPTRPPFMAGQMFKGTEALDPDGFPLAYAGARDGYLRVLALDGDRAGDRGSAPRELWRLGRHPEGV